MRWMLTGMLATMVACGAEGDAQVEMRDVDQQMGLFGGGDFVPVVTTKRLAVDCDDPANHNLPPCQDKKAPSGGPDDTEFASSAGTSPASMEPDAWMEFLMESGTLYGMMDKEGVFHLSFDQREDVLTVEGISDHAEIVISDFKVDGMDGIYELGIQSFDAKGVMWGLGSGGYVDAFASDAYQSKY